MIFDSYNDIPQTYIPENTKNTPQEKELIILPPMPIIKDNKLIGYYWKHGEQFKFNYTPKYRYYVEEDAIILTAPGVVPTTVGYRGQKAYNIKDKKSFVYEAGYNGDLWKVQPKYLIPINGTKLIETDIEVTPKTTFITMPLIKMDIFNFRNENIFTKSVLQVEAQPFVIDINEELATLLYQGSYEMRFTLISNGNEIIIDNYIIQIL